MRKLRVTVIHEFEIPDSWTIFSREEDNGHFLLIEGKLHRPDLQWLQLEGRDEDGVETWAEVEDEMDLPQVVQAKESIEEIG